MTQNLAKEKTKKKLPEEKLSKKKPKELKLSEIQILLLKKTSLV
jgi:hypothetical protein